MQDYRGLEEEEERGTEDWLTPLGSLVARERVALEAILFLQSISRNMAFMLQQPVTQVTHRENESTQRT